MLTFIMLTRVSKLCPAAVVQRLDRLVEPLKATCTTKVRPNMIVSFLTKHGMLSSKQCWVDCLQIVVHITHLR